MSGLRMFILKPQDSALPTTTHHRPPLTPRRRRYPRSLFLTDREIPDVLSSETVNTFSGLIT